MRTFDLIKDFDCPRDSCDYINMLTINGTPYEFVDETTIIVFDNQAEYDKWLETVSESDGFLLKVDEKRQSKKLIDAMSNDEIDKLIDDLLIILDS